MVCQDIEGDEVEAGVKMLTDLYEKARKCERTEVPASKLRIGLKCGGSDGFSGITANPLLGEFSDWLCDVEGGTTVLTEVPEMFGAETILMERCAMINFLERQSRSSITSKSISCHMVSLWGRTVAGQ